MRRLVDLADLERGQEAEVRQLLHRNGIHYRESPSGVFIDTGAIWVTDEHFERARELLRGQSRAFAADARAAWEEEWRTMHGRSRLRWFLHRLRRRPLSTLVRLFLLVVMVTLFALLPLWYAVHYVGRTSPPQPPLDFRDPRNPRLP